MPRAPPGIRFVQLQFTDIIGHVKAVTIPIHQLGAPSSTGRGSTPFVGIGAIGRLP